MKMIQSVRDMVKNKLYRNITVLAGGNLLAQIVNVLSAPVLSRLFSLEEFGAYAIFTSIYAIAVIFMNGKYEMAIIVEEDERMAGVLLKTCILFSLAALVPAVLLVSVYLRTTTLGNGDTTEFMCLLFASVVLGNAVHTLSRYLNRFGRYNSVSVSAVLYTLSYTALSIVLKVMWNVQNSMLYGYAFSTAVQAVFLFFSTWRKTPLRSAKAQWKDMLYLLKKHIRFPLYSAPSDAMNTLSTQIPVLLMTNLFGMQAAGAYGMANRIVGLPVAIMGSSVGTVYFTDASKAHHAGDMETLRKMTRDIGEKLLYMALVPMTLLMLYGKQLFMWVLGDKWAEAGQMAQGLAFWMLFVFVASPITGIWNVLRKQHLSLLVNAILLVSRTASIVLGFLVFRSPQPAILFFSLTGAMIWIFLHCYNLRLISLPAGRILLRMAAAITLSVVIIGYPGFLIHFIRRM
jgi:O-antigen/teichoic acid export membrane protein